MDNDEEDEENYDDEDDEKDEDSEENNLAGMRSVSAKMQFNLCFTSLQLVVFVSLNILYTYITFLYFQRNKTIMTHAHKINPTTNPKP